MRSGERSQARIARVGV